MSINSIIDALEGAHINRRQRVELAPLVDSLTDAVDVAGLTTRQLARLLRLACRGPSAIPVSLLSRIVRDCLIPTSPVPPRLVMQIVSSLGELNPVPIQLKARLVRWLVVVFEFLEEPEKTIRSLYGVLFANLKYELPRPYICHLLFLTTNSSVVRAWRVQALRDLYDKYSESQDIAALLAVYREYAPHLVTSQFSASYASVFRNPDLHLVSRTAQVFDSRGHKPLHVTSASRVIPNRTRLLHSVKRQKLGIPEIQTHLEAREATIVSIEDVDSLMTFASKIHLLQFPLQMGSTLQDTGALTRLLIYKGDETTWSRLSIWLSATLTQELDSPADLRFLLTRVIRFTGHTKAVPLAVEKFVYGLLSTWSRQDAAVDVRTVEVLLGVLKQFPLLPENILGPQVLEILAQVCPQSDTHINLELLNFASELLLSWRSRYQSQLKALLMEDDGSVAGMNLESVQASIGAVITFVETVGLRALREFNNDASVQDEILRFHEIVTSSEIFPVIPHVQVLAPELLSRLSTGTNLAVKSRLLTIFASYGSLFIESAEPSAETYRDQARDLYSTFWLDSAFQESNIYSPAIIQDLADYCDICSCPLEVLFGVLNSGSTAIKAGLYLRKLESGFAATEFSYEYFKRTCLTADSFPGSLTVSYDDFKRQFITELSSEGFEGPQHFMSRFSD